MHHRNAVARLLSHHAQRLCGLADWQSINCIRGSPHSPSCAMRLSALLPFQKMLLLEAADPEPKSHGVRGKTPPSGSRRFVVLLPRARRSTASSNFIEATGPKRVWEAGKVPEGRCSRHQRSGVTAVSPHAERGAIKIGVTSHPIGRYVLHRCTSALRLRDDV